MGRTKIFLYFFSFSKLPIYYSLYLLIQNFARDPTDPTRSGLDPDIFYIYLLTRLDRPDCQPWSVDMVDLAFKTYDQLYFNPSL